MRRHQSFMTQMNLLQRLPTSSQSFCNIHGCWNRWGMSCFNLKEKVKTRHLIVPHQVFGLHFKCMPSLRIDCCNFSVKVHWNSTFQSFCLNYQSAVDLVCWHHIGGTPLLGDCSCSEGNKKRVTKPQLFSVPSSQTQTETFFTLHVSTNQLVTEPCTSLPWSLPLILPSC